MTYKSDCTLSADLLQQVGEQGLDILPELVRMVVNAANFQPYLIWMHRPIGDFYSPAPRRVGFSF